MTARRPKGAGVGLAVAVLVASTGCPGSRGPVVEPLRGQIVERCRMTLQEQLAERDTIVFENPVATALGNGRYRVGATFSVRAQSSRYVVCGVVERGHSLEVTKVTVMQW
jgi:hypothetical protein